MCAAVPSLLTAAAGAKLYLNQTHLKQAVSSGAVKVTQGDAAEAAKILDLFDEIEPARNVTIPRRHD